MYNFITLENILDIKNAGNFTIIRMCCFLNLVHNDLHNQYWKDDPI